MNANVSSFLSLFPRQKNEVGEGAACKQDGFHGAICPVKMPCYPPAPEQRSADVPENTGLAAAGGGAV